MRWTSLTWWALVGVLSACSSTPPERDPDQWSRDDLLVRARGAAEDDPALTAEFAEALLTRADDSKQVQEALYLAGNARLLRSERKKAFRHYQTLIEDYPFSEFVPRISDSVYEIGSFYLSREPSAVFNDLFSGRPFGAEVMRQFAAAYVASDRADDALVAIAEYHMSREEYLFAADKYRMVLERYPDSEWADLSAYRSGLCAQRAGRGAGYDDDLMRTARQRYLVYLADDRRQGFRAEAEQGLREAENELAAGELKIARFYLLRENDRGARMHLANVVLAFPSTDAALEARSELETHGWDLSIHSLDTLERGLDG